MGPRSAACRPNEGGARPTGQEPVNTDGEPAPAETIPVAARVLRAAKARRMAAPNTLPLKCITSPVAENCR
jgi:hypothetical protein